MITKTVDTPAVNLREEARVLQITITPTTIFANIEVTSTDLTSGRLLGKRTPVKPPLASGLPAPIGIEISSLPAGVQTQLDLLVTRLLDQPFVLP